MSENLQCVSCGRSGEELSRSGSCYACLAEVAFGTSSEEEETRLCTALAEELFPEFEVIDCVGRGAMGSVFVGYDPKIEKEVAIKILDKDLVDDTSHTADRFIGEARTLARLEHPGIVRIRDFGQREQLLFLTLEYLSGGNLRDLMERGRITTRRAIDIAIAVCEALDYAHARGVIHRDIKPENLLFDGDGAVKIADFGLARAAGIWESEVGGTASDGRLGTAYYLAPEQAAGEAVDGRADLYSVGVVLYEMLTGELPVGHFPAPSGVRPDAGSEVDRVVLKALRSNPKDRYQTAADLLGDLRQARSGYPDPVEGPDERLTTAATRTFGRLTAAVLATWLVWAGLLFKDPVLSLAGVPGVGRSWTEVIAANLVFLILLLAGSFWFRLLPRRFGIHGRMIGWPLYRRGVGLVLGVTAGWLVMLGCTWTLGWDRGSSWAILVPIGTAPLVAMAVCSTAVRRMAGHSVARPLETLLFGYGLAFLTAGSVVVQRSVTWGLLVQAIAGVVCIWSAGRISRAEGEDRGRSEPGWLIAHLLTWLGVGLFASLLLSRDIHPHLRAFMLVPLGVSLTAALSLGHGFLWPAIRGAKPVRLVRGLFRPQVFVGWLLVPLLAGGLSRELPPGESRQLIQTMRLTVGHPRSILAPGDGQLLIIGDTDGTVQGLDRRTGRQVVRVAGPGSPVPIAWSDARRYLAVGGDRLSIVHVPGVGGGQTHPVDLLPPGSGESRMPTRALAFNRSGDCLAVARGDGLLELWSLSEKQARTAQAPSFRPLALRFSDDGTCIRMLGEDGQITAWDTTTCAPAAYDRSIALQNSPVAFDPDGSRLAVASDRLLIYPVELEGETSELVPDVLTRVARTWQNIAFFPCPAADRLAFGPRGLRLAAVVKDRVEIWDARESVLLETLQGHSGDIDAVTFSEDGSVVVTASGSDRTIKVWQGQAVTSL